MNQAKIGKLIVQLRKEQNLTQAQLGERLGITDKAVSKWERGLRVPDVAILNHLSNILNITTTELLDGERIQKNSQRKLLNDNYSETQYFKDISEALLLFLNNNYNDCCVDLIESQDSNYYINGLIVNSKEKEFIHINSIENISDDTIELERVYAYEYSLNIQNSAIYKLGNISQYKHCNKRIAIPINDILDGIKIYVVQDIKENNNFIKKSILTIKYINQELEKKDIIIPLFMQEIFSNNQVSYNNMKHF